MEDLRIQQEEDEYESEHCDDHYASEQEMSEEEYKSEPDGIDNTLSLKTRISIRKKNPTRSLRRRINLSSMKRRSGMIPSNTTIQIIIILTMKITSNQIMMEVSMMMNMSLSSFTFHECLITIRGRTGHCN